MSAAPRLQKHQRAIVKALKRAGYSVEVRHSGAKHPKLIVSRHGKTTKLPMAGSPTNAGQLPAQALRQVKEKIG
mgnify:CR=1 FL=1